MRRRWVAAVIILASVVVRCGDEVECPSDCPEQPILFPGIAVVAESTAATVVFTVDPRGAETRSHCEYATSLGSWSVSNCAVTEAGWGPQHITLRLGPLEPETWYLYRLRALNCVGSVSTEADSFQTLRVNLLPETFVTAGPVESRPDGGSSVHLYWFGVDADGTIDHFEWLTSDSEPPGVWHWTAQTESTLVFGGDISGEWVFSVRAVDNDGGVDPSPGYWTAPIGPRIVGQWRVLKGL
jgi:hypothetical protein